MYKYLLYFLSDVTNTLFFVRRYIPCCPEITVPMSLANIFSKSMNGPKFFYGKVSNVFVVMSKTHQESFRPIAATFGRFSIFFAFQKKWFLCGILLIKIPIVQMIWNLQKSPLFKVIFRPKGALNYAHWQQFKLVSQRNGCKFGQNGCKFEKWGSIFSASKIEGRHLFLTISGTVRY